MSESVVVDASLALKWVIPEDDSSAAIELLNQWMIDGTKVIAPALFVYEAANILYRQALANKLTYEEAKHSLRKLFSIGVKFKFTLYEDISYQAMEFARVYNLPATYDSHYLALAQSEKSDYWTADMRLWNSVKGKLNWVRWFGDYH